MGWEGARPPPFVMHAHIHERRRTEEGEWANLTTIVIDRPLTDPDPLTQRPKWFSGRKDGILQGTYKKPFPSSVNTM